MQTSELRSLMERKMPYETDISCAFFYKDRASGWYAFLPNETSAWKGLGFRAYHIDTERGKVEPVSIEEAKATLLLGGWDLVQSLTIAAVKPHGRD